MRKHKGSLSLLFYVALQNHAPVIRTWRDTYDLVKEVNSPWLKVCLDLPVFDKQDKDYIANAVHTVGNLQVHSHFGGEYYRDENIAGIDFVHEQVVLAREYMAGIINK